jgi:hypothetical protein
MAITKRFSSSTGMGLHNIGATSSQPPSKQVILFVGDSVSEQSYKASVCDLKRNGWVEMSRFTQNKSTECTLLTGPLGENLEVRYHGVHSEGVSDVQYAFAGATTVIFNIGVWYRVAGFPSKPRGNSKMYTADVKSALTQLAQWSSESPSNIAIWRGTLPQHFDSSDGAHPGRDNSTQGGSLCPPTAEPLPQSPYDSVVLDAYKSLNINDGSGPCSDKPLVYFVPLFDPLVPRYDAQMGSFVPEYRGEGALPLFSSGTSLSPL